MPWILTTGLNIPIETAGKRDFRTDRAVQLSDAARLRVSDALWAVRARLRAAMLALYSEQENLKLAQQMLHIEQDIAEHLVQQLTAGVISRLELHHAQLGVQQAQLNVLSSEKRLAENRVALATAIGLPVTALNAVELDFSEFAAPADLAAIPSAKLRATALQNRADIRAALADYAAAQAGLQLAIAGQYPDIQVNPSYSWQKGENRWGLGGLTVPLPLFNQNQGAIAEAQAKRQEMAVRVEALQARILGDIDKALAGVSAVLKKWKTVAQQQTDAQENRRNVQALIQAGESDALALLAADALSATTEQSRLAVLVESWQSLAQLEDSLRYPLAAAAYLNKQLVSQ
jgi:outer membrane protein TolC